MIAQNEQTKIDCSPHAKIHWIEDLEAVRVEWLQLFMSLDKFQSICKQAINVLQEGGGSIWIADSYESEGVFPDEIQTFITEQLVPLAKSVGIKRVLTILPKESGLASMATRKWQQGVKEKDAFIMEQFPNMQSCRTWIETF